MRRRLVLYAWATALMTTAAACGSTVQMADDPAGGEHLPEPGGAPTAEQAVTWWLDALAAGAYQEAAAFVYEQQLIVLVAGEGRSAEVVAGYLSDGLPDAVRDRFWGSFVESFAVFAGRPLSALAAGPTAVFDDDGRSFATVALRGAERSEKVVTTLDPDGGWRVDLVASFGASLARPLNTWRAGLGEGPAAAACRTALAAQRASLQVAADLLPPGPDSAASRAELLELIGPA